MTTPRSSYAAKIVATVQNYIITDYDLYNRTKLFMLLNKQDYNNNQIFQMTSRYILHIMIEETLKEIYAEKIGVTISDQEISDFIKILEQNLQLGKIDNFLNKHKIDRNAVINYAKIERLWGKVIQYQMINTIYISDEEVIQRLSAKKIPKNEKNLNNIKNEIFLEKIDFATRTILGQIRKFSYVETY